MNLDNYDTLACFVYGSEQAVSNFTPTVAEKIMSRVSSGATFISNRQACGAKILSQTGYVETSIGNWYPVLRDSVFVKSVDANDPLFYGVKTFSGNQHDYSVDYWDSGDHESILFRVDNSRSYTGFYKMNIGSPIIPPDKYLSTYFSTGWEVDDTRDNFPVWNKGNGRIIVIIGLNWTFDQATQKEGYIGIAGRQILRNIANGIAK